jgi:hypothetical protein
MKLDRVTSVRATIILAVWRVMQRHFHQAHNIDDLKTTSNIIY